MDILVCQSCGAFIRGRAKFCTGCGSYVTKFSPTALPIVAQSSLPLVVALSPDPLVLEKALIEQKFSQYNNGNGGNGGNGDHPGNQTDYQPAEPDLETLPSMPSMPSVPTMPTAETQAPSYSHEPPQPPDSFTATSHLSNIIASAGSKTPASKTAEAQQIFDLIGEEPEPVIPEPEPEEFAEPLPPPSPQVSIQPFHPASTFADTTDFAVDEHALPPGMPGIPGEAPAASAPEMPSPPAPTQPAPAQSFSPMAEVPKPTSSSGFSAVPTVPSIPAPSMPQQPASNFDVFSQSPAESEFSTKPAEPIPNPFTKESFAPSPGIPMPPPSASDRAQEDPYAEKPQPTKLTSPEESASQAQQVRGLLARRASNRSKHDMDEELEPADSKPSPLKMLTEEVEIAGKSIPKYALIVIGLVVVFLAFRLVGPIFNLVGGTFGDIIAQQKMRDLPSLSGTWQNRYQVDKKITTGKFYMEQDGTDIRGKGADPQNYIFAGKYQPPNISFKKQYLNDAGAEDGKPVACTGKVQFADDGRPSMAGSFVKQIGKGVFLTRRTVNLEGPFDAVMIQKSTSANQTHSKAASDDLNIDDIDVSDGNDKIQKTQQFFMKIALGILGFCILLAVASLKVFGPSGLLNIWGKKEFIPSQFRSQHNKMLKEMGKAWKKGALPLGKRLDWNILQFDKPQNLVLPPTMRDSNPHILVIGAGQKGKTRLMASMITNDILSGDRAVVVIDSDGSLVDLVVNWIAAQPKGQKIAERVIIMDPTHKGGCPAYNPLEMPENGDLQGAASAVVYGFKAIYTEPPGSQSQWNQQTANIVRNSALLLMANGKTLTDMEKLLSSDNDFRDLLLEKIERQKNERVEYNTLLTQWDNYKKLARSDQWITWTEPIRNRIAATLSDPRIQPILTKPKGDLNLVDVVNNKKVLLVKVPQSSFDDNANLLGSLIVTGLKQATLSSLPGKAGRHPSTLYLDEFDSFIEKDTIDTITSETKTFQIGLVGACKTLQHLPEDARNQLAIHMGTICAFSLAKKDADMLGPQMFRVDGRKIKHQTIQNVFNKVNTTPQFELISDEEKLNIDRVVGQEERTFFCYRVGTVAGVFHLKAPDFKDIPEKDINWSLVEQMYGKA